MSENDKGDALENVVDLKAVEAVIVEKFGEIKDTYEAINGQIKEQGEASAETIAKLETITKEYDTLCDRVQEIEQKGAASADVTPELNIGDEFVKHDDVLRMMEGKQASARMEFKTAIINATGQNQPLVPADRQMGIWTTPNRNLTVRDILPTSTTSSNLVEFTREASFTNNAAVQGTGTSPETFENVAKAESGITFTLHSEPVVTIAHFIPASKQVLDDAAGLSSHINGRLMYGLKLFEETQLLSGSGATGHELNGLITQGTAYVNSGSPNYTNEIDIIRDAIRQAHVGEYSPDFLVLNPQDFFDMEIRKVGASDDRYVVGNPRSLGPPTLWGLTAVVTNSIAAGTFLMGTSSACEIKDREQASVEISREHSDNFTKNMVTVLAEERMTLCVYRTEAFITGSL